MNKCKFAEDRLCGTYPGLLCFYRHICVICVLNSDNVSEKVKPRLKPIRKVEMFKLFQTEFSSVELVQTESDQDKDPNTGN